MMNGIVLDVFSCLQQQGCDDSVIEDGVAGVEKAIGKAVVQLQRGNNDIIDGISSGGIDVVDRADVESSLQAML